MENFFLSRDSNWYQSGRTSSAFLHYTTDSGVGKQHSKAQKAARKVDLSETSRPKVTTEQLTRFRAISKILTILILAFCVVDFELEKKMLIFGCEKRVRT